MERYVILCRNPYHANILTHWEQDITNEFRYCQLVSYFNNYTEALLTVKEFRQSNFNLGITEQEWFIITELELDLHFLHNYDNINLEFVSAYFNDILDFA